MSNENVEDIKFMISSGKPSKDIWRYYSEYAKDVGLSKDMLDAVYAEATSGGRDNFLRVIRNNLFLLL